LKLLTSRFFWRRAFPSLLLVSTFVLLYEATVSDSRYAARQAQLMEVPAALHGEEPAPQLARAAAIRAAYD